MPTDIFIAGLGALSVIAVVIFAMTSAKDSDDDPWQDG
ncbi:hypothetical protein Ga0080574_TMP3673 [Salipiger abyssi]|uniref:Uncharacterized protein n=1 Tax=Salipiger abyssi TaxID=1250539 RepID=A0A1P8UX90_9RHOB|nr:hypothetical protein Ga0080574_TMP3673 [Salipiger abyssi]